MTHLRKNGVFERFANGAIAGLGFALTVLIVSMAYAALNYSVPMSTVSTGSGLSSVEWNKMVANFGTIDAQLTSVTSAIVPSGAVMAFNLGICPSGWSAADGTGGRPDLRGQFIRGLNSFDNGVTTRTDGSQDPDCTARTGGCVLRSTQADELKSHTHSLAGMTVSTVAL